MKDVDSLKLKRLTTLIVLEFRGCIFLTQSECVILLTITKYIILLKWLYNWNGGQGLNFDYGFMWLLYLKFDFTIVDLSWLYLFL